MTTSIDLGATYGAATLSNTNAHDAATTQAHADGNGVQISKADGLRGVLGLYELTTDGNTRFVTKEELENMPRIAGSATDGAATAMLSSSTIKKENDTTNGTIRNLG